MVVMESWISLIVLPMAFCPDPLRDDEVGGGGGSLVEAVLGGGSEVSLLGLVEPLAVSLSLNVLIAKRVEGSFSIRDSASVIRCMRFILTAPPLLLGA